MSFLQPALKQLVLSGNSTNYKLLRDSMWLYLALLALVDEQGKVITSFQELAKGTGLKEATLQSWSGHLRSLGFLRFKQKFQEQIVCVLPRIKFSREQVIAQPIDDERIVFAKSLCKNLNDDESNLNKYIELSTKYSKELLSKLLAQVQKVPDDKIRVSRASLFNYLLKTNENKN